MFGDISEMYFSHAIDKLMRSVVYARIPHCHYM
uniref:Bm14673 n=1 Tax=Brugia malayi TaxID=6279 RepID=A0A1I9G558_BRUMA|nr:Bm14673 [Brugia malayi]